jgi:hypothetical protein
VELVIPVPVASAELEAVVLVVETELQDKMEQLTRDPVVEDVMLVVELVLVVKVLLY